MKQFMLVFCLGILTLVLLAVVALGLLTAHLKPDDYREALSGAVRKITGRAPVFEGNVRLTVFPRPGITTGKARLGDDTAFGLEPFASAQGVTLYFALRPLLERRLEIEGVVLEGLTVKLATASDGRRNWEFGKRASVGAPESSGGGAREGVTPLYDERPPSKVPESTKSVLPPFSLRVSSLSCPGASMRYVDMKNGVTAQMDFDDFSVTNIHLDGEKAEDREGVGRFAALEGDLHFTAKSATLDALAVRDMQADLHLEKGVLNIRARGLRTPGDRTAGNSGAAGPSDTAFTVNMTDFWVEDLLAVVRGVKSPQ